MDIPRASLKPFLKKIPANPGVYLMKDGAGRVIYVGKAKSLAARVNSYFLKHAAHNLKTEKMVSLVEEIDYIITSNEIEALILENTLIKKHSPKYNILLRDDKTYPFLRLTLEERFPRLVITRRVNPDCGSRYYGPFTSAGNLREVFTILNRYFHLATCKHQIDGHASRPCLQYQLKRCGGACAGLQKIDEYTKNVELLSLFLDGRDELLESCFKNEMNEYAVKLEYEKAAIFRDKLSSLRQFLEKQRVVSLNGEDKDVIGVMIKGDTAYVDLLFIRSGSLTGKVEHCFEVGSDNLDTDAVRRVRQEVILAFIKQFYAKNIIVPAQILVSEEIANMDHPVVDISTGGSSDPEAGLELPELHLLEAHLLEVHLIEAWLSKKRNGAVKIITPKRGDNYHLIKLALKNVEASAGKMIEESAENRKELIKLQALINLSKIPKRIEVFDISNISGDMAVGSMVVLEDNKFNKRAYKRFKIKTVHKSDDFEMMREVVSRHYAKAEPPDLIIVDGGRGQLSAALDGLRACGIEPDISSGHPSFEIIGLAKEKGERFERVFKPGDSQPFILPVNNRSTFILQNIRDEAHRFAITYHKQLRLKRNRRSALDEVDGIGAKRKKLLLKEFGSVKQLKSATVDEIVGKGINMALAVRILDHLNKQDSSYDKTYDK